MRRLSFAFIIGACVALLASCQKPRTVEVIALQDNAQPRLMAAALFADTAPEGLISSLGLDEGVPASVCAFLMKVDGKTVLFDAGNGNDDSQLHAGLSANGVQTADIDYIMITHMHGDHIGGMTNDGKAVFENATLYIPKAEYDGWMAMGEERSAQMRAMIEAYGDRVKIFTEQEALPCGIEAVAAPGHTPGHTLYRANKALIVGDIMHGVALQLENPEVCARFDMDHATAISSRKSVIEMAKAEGLTLYGMHFPAPFYLEF